MFHCLTATTTISRWSYWRCFRTNPWLTRVEVSFLLAESIKMSWPQPCPFYFEHLGKTAWIWKSSLTDVILTSSACRESPRVPQSEPEVQPGGPERSRKLPPRKSKADERHQGKPKEQVISLQCSDQAPDDVSTDMLMFCWQKLHRVVFAMVAII